MFVEAAKGSIIFNDYFDDVTWNFKIMKGGIYAAHFMSVFPMTSDDQITVGCTSDHSENVLYLQYDFPLQRTLFDAGFEETRRGKLMKKTTVDKQSYRIPYLLTRDEMKLRLKITNQENGVNITLYVDDVDAAFFSVTSSPNKLFSFRSSFLLETRCMDDVAYKCYDFSIFRYGKQKSIESVFAQKEDCSNSYAESGYDKDLNILLCVGKTFCPDETFISDENSLRFNTLLVAQKENNNDLN